MNNLRPHTKVRRLGYLKLLVVQYFKSDFISINTAKQYFEKIASTISVKTNIRDYDFFFRKDSKGVIDDIGTGVSSEPYLKLAEDLSIIAKNNYSYILTKYGKVYKVILEQYAKNPNKFKFFNDITEQPVLDIFSTERQSENIFILSYLDKLFFLKQILEKDFIYFKSILQIIKNQKTYKVNKKVKYFIVKENLHSEIFKQLTEVLNLTVDSVKKIEILAIRSDYENKNLSIRSYEDIVEPRIGWLLDLDLIDNVNHKQGILKLSNTGLIFYNYLNKCFDITAFLEQFYVKAFSQAYNLISKNELNANKKIEKYLQYAFTNFRTLSPNRVSASQAITYISWMCILREGFILEYSTVKDYIFNNDGKGFTIDWYPSENDGSIKKVQ